MAPVRKTRALALACVVLMCLFYWSITAANHKPQRLATKVELLKRQLVANKDYKEKGLNFQSRELSAPRLTSLIHEQLSAAFPYEPEKGFQKNIWQTWKVGLDHETFPHTYRKWHDQWDAGNGEYGHYLISDPQCDIMVDKLYAKVPGVREAWNAMPKSILKADFFRYLILFAKGGVYSDIDTRGLKPIDSWVSHNATLWGKPNIAGLVVGIEADPDRPDWHDWYARRIQFCQWTIMAKRGHPMLLNLIAKIATLTLDRKKGNKLGSVLGKDEGGDIMDWTGPGIFTDMVFEYMNRIVQSDEGGELRNVIDWEVFTGMQVPLAIEDVLVLPITSFSPNVGQMGAGTVDHELAYVQHMFLGSWKH